MSTYNRVVAADENASLAPTVRARLATEMADPTSDVGASLSGTFVARRVHVVILIGQSNMSGRGTQWTTLTDPINSRIYQFGSGATSIAQMTNVLDMVDVPTGISPGLLFSRHLIESLGDDDVVLLVPAAKGNTALSSASSDAWRWGTAGGLSERAVTQYESAVAAATTEWPNAQVVTAAILWHQGEADNATSESQYRIDLEALVVGFRAATGETTPFISGQLVPEYVKDYPANSTSIVLSTMPTTVDACGYAGGPPIRYSWDRVHWNLPGLRVLAANYWTEYRRIVGGIAYGRTAPFVANELVWAEDFDRPDTSLDEKPPRIDNLGRLQYDASSGLTVADGVGTFSSVGQIAIIYGVDAIASGVMSVNAGALGNYPVAIARYKDYSNYILVTHNATNLYLQSRVAGSQSTIASAAFAYASGETLSLKVNGDSISVLVDGVEKITPQTVTAFAGTNRFGYGTYSSGSGGLTINSAELRTLP